MHQCRRLFTTTLLIGALAVAALASSSPTAASADGGFHVGLVRCTFIDHSRSVLNYSTSPPSVLTRGRVLVTEIRYPTVGSASNSVEVVGARPATRSGGFPMIVFAHGYDVTPDTYSSLLDAWAQQGFVVAAPVFPDENTNAIALQHDANTEGDLVNEPADLAFVTRQLVDDSAKATPSCPLASGLINATSLALAGHSDGGEAVGMLSNSLGRDPQGVAFASLRSGLAYRAVIVMSGAEDGAGPFHASTMHSALLVVQSAADTCNAADEALRLYRAIGQNDKWFLELITAHHLPPYDGEDAVALTMVSGVTVRFLQQALEPATSSSVMAFGASRPAVAQIFHAGSGPSIAPLKGPPHCGFH